jgi:hypothetical protein
MMAMALPGLACPVSVQRHGTLARQLTFVEVTQFHGGL